MTLEKSSSSSGLTTVGEFLLLRVTQLGPGLGLACRPNTTSCSCVPSFRLELCGARIYIRARNKDPHEGS